MPRDNEAIVRLIHETEQFLNEKIKELLDADPPHPIFDHFNEAKRAMYYASLNLAEDGGTIALGGISHSGRPALLRPGNAIATQRETVAEAVQHLVEVCSEKQVKAEITLQVGECENTQESH